MSRVHPTVDTVPVVSREDGKVPVGVVVAVTPEGGIGREGQLPWNLPSDMAFFRHITKAVRSPDRQNAVVMGRKTWRSIPERFRPLKDRLNVVLSSAPVATVRAEEELHGDVLVADTVLNALELLNSSSYRDTLETIFVIGGSAAFAEVLERGLVDVAHVTEIETRGLDCDVFIPWPMDARHFELGPSVGPLEENGHTFQFRSYVRRGSRWHVPPSDGPTGEGSPRSSRPNVSFGAGPPAGEHEEMQYLRIIEDILDTGVERDDRTGVGTISKFGVQMRFSLRDEVLPLLTTKRVFWRGVAEELLWFLRGDTNARHLQEKRVRIWDGNSTRSFLDQRGLSHREEGDLGPVYGFQWRHFGAAYTDMHADYSGKGVDQIAQIIHTIRTNPHDRRIILSAWNPAALPEMALPPCHLMCQFYVSHGELSCQMYQRSADMGLGVPFNIASYALLTRILAQVCGLRAGELVHLIGDAHVYKNHVTALREQGTRTPRPFPRLRIDPSVTQVDDFRYEHLTVEGYEPHPKISMEMAV